MAKRPAVLLACLKPDFGTALQSYLDRRGYDVRRASEEWELRAMLAGPAVDIVVLGDAHTAASALDLMRQLQERHEPGIIVLRPRADLVETVLALELGAADVVVAPYTERELAARISGLLSRQGRGSSDLVALENSTVDLRAALSMHKSGAEEQLSPGQIALLRLFLANPRKVLTRDDIIAAAPAENADAFDRSIDSRIVRLRRKLDTESIVTIRGSGYRFDPPAGWPE